MCKSAADDDAFSPGVFWGGIGIKCCKSAPLGPSLDRNVTKPYQLVGIVLSSRVFGFVYVASLRERKSREGPDEFATCSIAPRRFRLSQMLNFARRGHAGKVCGATNVEMPMGSFQRPISRRSSLLVAFTRLEVDFDCDFFSPCFEVEGNVGILRNL